MAAAEYILVAFPNGSEGAGGMMKTLEKSIAGADGNYSGEWFKMPDKPNFVC
jgi:hypothetical protein